MSWFKASPRLVFLTAMLIALPAVAQDSRPKVRPLTPESRPRSKPVKGTDQVEKSNDAAIVAMREFIAEQKEDGKIDTTKSGWKTRLPKFPAAKFTEGQDYLWHLKTNKGPITIKLRPEVAPNHVRNVLYLAEAGYYDGLIFHRVIPGFMAQGGCPMGNGMGSPGYNVDLEVSPSVKHDQPGVLSMARSQSKNSAGAQFFITFKATPFLDNQYSVFGIMESGMDTLRAMEAVGSQSGATSENLSIEKAWVSTRPSKD